MFSLASSRVFHDLVKSSSPGFRTVLQDAPLLFALRDLASTEVPCMIGFDSRRLYSWNREMTRGPFAGVPHHRLAPERTLLHTAGGSSP